MSKIELTNKEKAKLFDIIIQKESPTISQHSDGTLQIDIDVSLFSYELYSYGEGALVIDSSQKLITKLAEFLLQRYLINDRK